MVTDLICELTIRLANFGHNTFSAMHTYFNYFAETICMLLLFQFRTNTKTISTLHLWHKFKILIVLENILFPWQPHIKYYYYIWKGPFHRISWSINPELIKYFSFLWRQPGFFIHFSEILEIWQYLLLKCGPILKPEIQCNSQPIQV